MAMSLPVSRAGQNRDASFLRPFAGQAVCISGIAVDQQRKSVLGVKAIERGEPGVTDSEIPTSSDWETPPRAYRCIGEASS